MEIKAEADRDDMAECLHDEQPNTCMFFLFYSPDILLSCFLVAVYVIILI